MRLPEEFDEIVAGTNDGFRRQLRYTADGDDDWTVVDLATATEVTVYLLTSAGEVAFTFLAKTTHVALFPERAATGYLAFQPASDTFAAADVGSYILRIKVTNATWPAGKTFPSDVGVRIVP